jgi:predicted enzyme related to lactoylglutathione lyase
MHSRTRLAFLLYLIPSILTAAGESRPEPWSPIAGKPQYFAVSVADLDASIAWYSTAFGLRKLDDQSADDKSWRIVNLASDDLFVELIHDRRDQPVKQARGFAKVGYTVADVAVVADRVGRATGKRPRVLEFPQQGLRLIQLQDPDGNLIQLSSPLPKVK